MHPLSRPGRHPREIRSIADEVGGRRQFGAHLRRGLCRRSRSEPDHDDLTGPGLGNGRLEARIVPSAGNDDHREVRDFRRVDVGERQHALRRRRGPFHIPGFVEPSDSFEGRAHSRERAAQFEHRDGIGAGEHRGQLVDRECSRYNGQYFFAFDERDPQCRRRPTHRRHPGNDLCIEVVGKAFVHMHVRAEEQRVTLGQQTDIPPGPQMRRECFGALGIEVVEGAAVAAGMIGCLDRDRVHQTLFDLIAAQVRLGDAPGNTVSMASAVIGDDVGSGNDPRGFDGDQLAVARAESYAPELSVARLFRRTFLVAWCRHSVIPVHSPVR
ncbi:Uncharacterised protein [Mycobacteroides abscessus subsp. abscessus]|nr:Uncharacterised protein [Mycobacteroides abscessus subsp. abscessus]